MKSRPILFSAPMVRAIREGRKTQTRRIFKQAIGPSLSVGFDEETGIAELSWLRGPGPGYDVEEHIRHVRCPYGQPGDELWGREHWYQRGDWRQSFHPESDDDDISWHGTDEIIYAADKRPLPPLPAGQVWRSRPSIHMPRWASRIKSPITHVCLERLQDISEADATAEGTPGGHGVIPGYAYNATPVEHFRWLWESINGTGSWAANPWVWVVAFERESSGG